MMGIDACLHHEGGTMLFLILILEHRTFLDHISGSLRPGVEGYPNVNSMMIPSTL